MTNRKLMPLAVPEISSATLSLEVLALALHIP
jgi:hypothetical protein